MPKSPKRLPPEPDTATIRAVELLLLLGLYQQSCEQNGSDYWSWASGYDSGRLQEFDPYRTTFYGFNIIQYN